MQKLTDFIDEIEGTGSFCTSGILKNCLPGISIKGYGELSFPVTAKEIKILKEYFKDAPYGKGTKTVIDKKVRSTKELDPKNITIANPE